MKVTILFGILLSLNAFSAGWTLPESHEVVLNCPSTSFAPHFKISRVESKGDFTYYLVGRGKDKARKFKLEITDGDCGYSTLQPVSMKTLKDLAEFADYIYINNNDEDLENPDDAVITRGSITKADRTEDQDCDVIGEPRVNVVK